MKMYYILYNYKVKKRNSRISDSFVRSISIRNIRLIYEAEYEVQPYCYYIILNCSSPPVELSPLG